jgi:flagellar FliJ protein
MFHFRLQTLLRLRIAERDQRLAELAKALRAEEVLRAEDQQVAEEQNTLSQQSRALKAPGSADVDRLLQTHRYELLLGAKRKQLATQIQQVQTETERRRLVVVEADRQVRVLEKLKERQAATHRREADRQEAKLYDEMATIGYSRRREAIV